MYWKRPGCFARRIELSNFEKHAGVVGLTTITANPAAIAPIPYNVDRRKVNTSLFFTVAQELEDEHIHLHSG